MMTSGNPRSLGAGENRWLGSLREFRSIRVVAFCGVMCALAMILSAVATVNLGPYVKIGLSGIPNQVVDYLSALPQERCSPARSK